MSFPLKNDREQAKEFLFDYMEATLADPEALAGWQQLNMIVGIDITDLELGFTLDCSGEEVIPSHGYPEQPDAGLAMASGIFHNLFLGKGNVMMDFTMGKIKTSGNMGNILKIVNLLPQNIKVYQKFLEERGYA